MEYQTHIQIACDSVTQLRKLDVFRVLEWSPEESRAGLVDWIKTHRLDLTKEVDSVLRELTETQAE